MRLFSVLILLCIVIPSSYSQKFSERELLGIQGPVRSATYEYISYKESFGEWEVRSSVNYVSYDFDIKGNTIEELYPDGNNSYFWKYTTKYDTYGNNIEFVDYLPDGSYQHKVDNVFKDGKLSEIITYTKSSQGQLLKREFFDNEKRSVKRSEDNLSGLKIDITYDFIGNDLAKEEKYINNILSTYILYKYNDDQDLIELTEYSGNNEIIKKDRILYNDILITDIDTYGKEGNLIHKNKYKYTNTGNILEMHEYDSNGLLILSHQYFYNSSEKIIGHTINNSQGTITERYTYSIDESGNRTIKYEDFNNRNTSRNIVNGQLESTIIYNSKHERILIKDIFKSVSSKGVVSASESIICDPDNNPLEIIYHRAGREFEKTEYQYMDNMTTITHTYNSLVTKTSKEHDKYGYLLSIFEEGSNGERIYNQKKEYDEYENLLLEELYDKGVLIQRIVYDYEFDQFGNWIKITENRFSPLFGEEKVVGKMDIIRHINYYETTDINDFINYNQD